MKRERHGLSRTPTYKIWVGMRARCRNPRCPEFKHYGGRGISVCERWAQFSAFFADMGECPQGYSIERRDVDGNYEPGNCCWIPLVDQAKNTRIANGIRRLIPEIFRLRDIGRTYQQIASETGISGATLHRIIASAKTAGLGSNWRTKALGSGRGWTKVSGNPAKSYQVQFRRKQVGTFATQEEAEAAYHLAVSAEIARRAGAPA